MSSRKKIVQKETSNSKKKVFSENIDPNKYLSKKPTWKFNRCDLSSPKWSILDSESFSQDILSKLISYEGMTWAEIQSSSGGKVMEQIITLREFVICQKMRKIVRNICI